MNPSERASNEDHRHKPYSNNVKACIKRAGYKIQEVVNEIGVPRSTFAEYLVGKRPFPHDCLQQVAHVLGCDIKDFVVVSLSYNTRHNTSLEPQERNWENFPISHEQPSQEEEADMDKMRRLVIEGIAAILGLSHTPFSQDIVRSDALDRLASAKPSSLSIDEPTVLHLMKINEGCWHLTNGSELTLLEQLLPTYLPTLATVAQQKSKNQSVLASLASQGYLLDGLVALDHLDTTKMEKTSSLAVHYSELAQDYNLHAAALKQQATMYLIDKKPRKALLTYQKALPFIDRVSPLLRSRVYQGLASASARCGLDEAAHYYLGLAFDTFPPDFEKDPSFLFADSGLSVLYMYAGLTHLDLDEPSKAWDAFAQVDGIHPKIVIGEWTRLEFLNLQTKAAIAMKNQGLSRTYLKAAMQQADKLDSRYGRAEAFDLWQSMRFVWSGDRSVKQLGDLFA